MWSANRNLSKIVVKAFPAYWRGKRVRGASSGRPAYAGPRLKRISSSWERIQAKDSERSRLLRSPLRWLLVLTLGYLVIDALAASRLIGTSSLLLLAVLWGSAFSRTLTFRVMCSGILLAATASLGFLGVEILQVAGMVMLSLALLILALRSFPVNRTDRIDSDSP